MNPATITSSVWVTLLPVVVVDVVILTLLAIFTFTRKKPETPDEVKTRHNSKFLSGFLKEWWYWVNTPIAQFFVRIGLKPNSITMIGTFISFISAFFFAKGLFGYAGWIMIFGATFDMFDGKVARLTGQETRSGAYLDSVMDRFGEGVVFAGLAYFYRETWLLPIVIVGLVGSMLVSYTRARGEGVGVVCKKGAMQRPERIVYLGVASVLQPMATYLIVPYWPEVPAILVIVAIVIIALMTTITAIQRIIYIMNELDNMDRDEDTLSLPQLISNFSTKEGREKWRLHAKYGYDRTHAIKEFCLMIMVDGIGSDLFNELIARGELPNINKYIIEPGMLAKATTTFPSTTGPAFAPFVTGCYAGTADIPGIRWFDRRVPPDKKLTIKRFRDYFGLGTYALDSDLSKNVKTIFEYSRRAVNIMGMVNRGAGVIRDPGFLRAPFLFYQAKMKDNIEAVERSAYRMFLSSLNRRPDFIFYYFPTVDKYREESEGSNDLVSDAYRRLDSYLGDIAAELKGRGILDSTLLILTSDHGSSNIDKHLDLDKFLEERFKTLEVPTKYKEWMEAESINMVSGSSMANIYLRSNEWAEYNFFENIEKTGLVDELLAEPAIDIVSGRSLDRGVIVRSQRGRAKITETDDGGFAYQIFDKDPFGYGPLPQKMTEEDALKLTWNTEYPDGIVQSIQLFRSARAGDLVISAAPNFDLRKSNEVRLHHSTHGSLRAEHMFVPFCINTKIESEQIRTVDIFSTVLANLGIIPDHNMDGKPLI